MARGVADRQEDRLVARRRLGERLVAPRVPVHRVVRVLQQVGARLLARRFDGCGRSGMVRPVCHSRAAGRTGASDARAPCRWKRMPDPHPRHGREPEPREAPSSSSALAGHECPVSVVDVARRRSWARWMRSAVVRRPRGRGSRPGRRARHRGDRGDPRAGASRVLVASERGGAEVAADALAAGACGVLPAGARRILVEVFRRALAGEFVLPAEDLSLLVDRITSPRPAIQGARTAWRRSPPASERSSSCSRRARPPRTSPGVRYQPAHRAEPREEHPGQARRPLEGRGRARRLAARLATTSRDSLRGARHERGIARPLRRLRPCRS